MRQCNYSDRNDLLAALLDAGGEEMRPHLKLVALKYGDVLYEVQSKLVDVYFPTTAVVSLLSIMEDGSADESAFVGAEGVIGIPMFLGGKTSPHRVVVRSAGHAFRLNGQVLMKEYQRSSATKNALLRYTHSMFLEISQNLVCRRHHSIQQQFCRLLLSSLDRLHSDEVCLTQEAIAGLLSVRRESITKAARELQEAGLVLNTRRKMVVVDRPGLEARACECYREINREFGRRLTETNGFYRANLQAPDRHAAPPPVRTNAVPQAVAA